MAIFAKLAPLLHPYCLSYIYKLYLKRPHFLFRNTFEKMKSYYKVKNFEKIKFLDLAYVTKVRYVLKLCLARTRPNCGLISKFFPVMDCFLLKEQENFVTDVKL